MGSQKSPPRTASGNGRGWQLQNYPTTLPADLLLPRLDGVRQTAADSWIARCPAHPDRNPSLSIRQADDRILVHCFAGCANDEIVAALGLTLGDLFDRPLTHAGKPLSQRQRKRYGQAREALTALLHETRVVWLLAEQVYAGYALDPEERKRLRLAMERVTNAGKMAA